MKRFFAVFAFLAASFAFASDLATYNSSSSVSDAKNVTYDGYNVCVGPGTNYWDGGQPATTTSQLFVATGQFHGYLNDAGYAMASFSCSGVGGNGVGNGQPCLSNPTGIVEIYGHTVGTAQEALGQTEGLCPIEIYDMGPDHLTDGGDNLGTAVCVGRNGSGDKFWRLMRNGDMLMDGTSFKMRSQRAIISATHGTQPYGGPLELYGNPAGGQAHAASAVQMASSTTMYRNDDIVQVISNVGEFDVLAEGAIRLGSLASNELPPCNSTYKGYMALDNTRGEIVRCNGTNFLPLRPAVGTLTLTGSGTASTSTYGSKCFCQDTTTASICVPSWSSGTFTATVSGHAGDSVVYECWE